MSALQARVYEFVTGIEATPQPDAGTPSDSNDLVTLGFLGSLAKVLQSSTPASPYSVVAGTGIPFASVAGYAIYVIYVKGSGGAVNISASPQFTAPGTDLNKFLILIGTDDTNTVTTENGNGLAQNGECILRNGSVQAYLSTDASTWTEIFRSGV